MSEPLPVELIRRILSFCDRKVLFHSKKVSSAFREIASENLRQGHAELQADRSLSPICYCGQTDEHTHACDKAARSSYVAMLDIRSHGAEYNLREKSPLNFPNLKSLRIWTFPDRSFCHILEEDFLKSRDDPGEDPSQEKMENFAVQLSTSSCKIIEKLNYTTLVFPNAIHLGFETHPLTGCIYDHHAFGPNVNKVVQIIRRGDSRYESERLALPHTIKQLVIVFALEPGLAKRGLHWSDDYRRRIEDGVVGCPELSNVHVMTKNLSMVGSSLYTQPNLSITVCNVEVLDHPDPFSNPVIERLQSLYIGPPRPPQAVRDKVIGSLVNAGDGMVRQMLEDNGYPVDVLDKIRFMSFGEYLRTEDWHDDFDMEVAREWSREV